jgi:hypothetical protein
MSKDGDPPLLVDEDEPQRVLVEFSYEDNNPIVVLKTSRESREIALLVYQSFVKGERIIYFCPDRHTLLFARLEAVFLERGQVLSRNYSQTHSIMKRVN